jgi:hypothetical protein
LTLSKWHICGQTPPVVLLGETVNLPIMNSKWSGTVTYGTRNKQLPKDESEKSLTNKFSYGDTHLMEASLSRRDTLYRRNSIIFKKITSGQQYGNQKSSPKYLLSYGFYFRTIY